MKILIELPTWLGDSVMATPAIENIIDHFDNREITLIGSKVSIETLKFHPKVHKAIVLNKNYISLYRFIKNSEQFDIFFSFRSSFRSLIFKLFVKCNEKFQFDKSNYQNQHQVNKYNNFINDSLNIQKISGPLVIHQKSIYIGNKARVLGINPGAAYGSAKRWYPKEFAKVAAELSTYYDIKIFGSNNEIEFANDIEKFLKSKGISNYENLSGNTSISELISHIANLDLFITADSGPMHIAACFEVPTVSIFGPTKDDETSQWMNKKNRILKKNLSCQPCMKRFCPLGHHNCMKEIKSKDVLEAIETIY
jgi:heptosyltransferase-2